MSTGGVVITARDEESIPVFLGGGVFGRELRLGTPDDPNIRTYIRALADFAACRRGDHVFFQTSDRFMYAGRVRGADKHGAFYLNGRPGFLGRRADAPFVWEGTEAERVRATGRRPGARPFLLRFGDDLGLAGYWVDRHSVYRSLGDYPYLLPTTWANSSMVSISPGETKRLLSLLVEDPVGHVSPAAEVGLGVWAEAVPYEPKYGPNLLGAWTAEGLTAAILAHPLQLPSLRPPEHAALAHWVPISPYRPSDVPTVDVAWYSDRDLGDGTIPDVLLFVSAEPAGLDLRRRIERQRTWLDRLLGTAVDQVEFKAVAPGFSREFYEPDRDGSVTEVEDIRVTLNRTGL